LAAAVAPFALGASLIVGVGGGLLYLVGTNEDLMESIEGVVTKTDDLKTDTEVNTASIGTSWDKLEQSMKVSAEDAAKGISVSTASTYTDIYSKMGDARNKVETDSKAAKDSAVKSFDDLKTGVSTSMDKAKETINKVSSAWKGDLGTMEKDADTKTGSIKTKVGTNMDGVKQKVTANIGDASKKWKTSLTEMDTNATEKTGKIKTTVQTCATSVKTSFEGASGATKVAGSNVMIGFYNGLVEKWNDKVTPFIEDIAQWIADHKGPEEYDRRLLVGNGEAIMEGLYDGLTNGFEDDVRPEVEGMADRIEDAMGDTSVTVGFDATTDEFKAATEGMLQTWKVATADMGTDTGRFAEMTREAMGEAFEGFSKSAVDGFGNVTRGFYVMSTALTEQWAATMSRMTEEVLRLGDVTRMTMTEMQSAFAQGIASNISMATQSASAYRAPTQVNATLELDRVQFGRMVYQLGDEESQRVGVRLAGGYA
jgi:hypothetical protein